MRLVDGDEGSLRRRLARALDSLPSDCTVLRFTYWYTARPPVYEAVVQRAAGTGAERPAA